MNILKLIFSKKLKHNIAVASLILFSFFLLSARIAITKTNYFLFLVWNVFLASIPYIITIYLSEQKKLNKLLLAFAFLVWLVFLPNAPYIITDLYHLKGSSHHLIWLDTLVIITFALTGIVLFYNSLNKMLNILKKYNVIKHERFLLFLICFLSAFGIYLGRFMRYNSWEIISNPKQLITDIQSIISHPILHSSTWLFTIFFGLFLIFGDFILKYLKSPE